MHVSIKSYRELEVWQLAMSLAEDVYGTLKALPNDERFALTSQLRRAVVSIPSNIAEGTGRMAVKEQIHFLEIAFGSLMEVYCQLQIAVDLGYISQEDLQAAKREIFTTSKLISGLRSSKVNSLNKD